VAAIPMASTAFLGDLAEDANGFHFVTLRGAEPTLHSIAPRDFQRGELARSAR